MTSPIEFQGLYMRVEKKKSIISVSNSLFHSYQPLSHTNN